MKIDKKFIEYSDEEKEEFIKAITLKPSNEDIKSAEKWIKEYQNRKKLSGFFDLDPIVKCNHPNHNPPQHLHIPQGKGYRHICPSCGKETVLIPPQISF